jgi:hypothetical protein
VAISLVVIMMAPKQAGPPAEARRNCMVADQCATQAPLRANPEPRRDRGATPPPSGKRSTPSSRPTRRRSSRDWIPARSRYGRRLAPRAGWSIKASPRSTSHTLGESVRKTRRGNHRHCGVVPLPLPVHDVCFASSNGDFSKDAAAGTIVATPPLRLAAAV